jgi:hypothetical protein
MKPGSRDYFGKMVREAVEETLNALLDGGADRLCGADRYPRKSRQEVPIAMYLAGVSVRPGR